MLSLRFRSGADVQSAERPRTPELRRQLSAPTVALLQGDGNALRVLCDERRLDPQPPPPQSSPSQSSHARWSPGRNARTPAVADSSNTAGMTAEQRYLFDLHGFVHLKGVLSPEELAAARCGTAFCAPFCLIHNDHLPRQARDKHIAWNADTRSVCAGLRSSARASPLAQAVVSKRLPM